MTQASLNDSVKLVLDLNISRLDGAINQALWGDVQVKLKLHHLYPDQVIPGSESVVWEAIIQSEAINGQIALNLGSGTDATQPLLYASHFINSHRGFSLNDGIIFTAQIATDASTVFYPFDTQLPFIIPITYVPYSSLSYYSLETASLLWSDDLPILQNAYVQLLQSSQIIDHLFSQLSFSQGTVTSDQLLNFSLLADDFSDHLIQQNHFSLNWRLSANMIQNLSVLATTQSDSPLQQTDLNQLLLDNSISWNKINWAGYVFGQNGDVFQLEDQTIYDSFISFRDSEYAGISFDRLNYLSFPNVLQRFVSSNEIYSESDSINFSQENVFSGQGFLFTNKLAFTRFNFHEFGSDPSPINFSSLLFNGNLITSNMINFLNLSTNSIPFNKISIDDALILTDYLTSQLISSNHLTNDVIYPNHLNSYIIDNHDIANHSVYAQHIYPLSLLAYNFSSTLFEESPLFLDYDSNLSSFFINLSFLSDDGLTDQLHENQLYLKLDPIYLKGLYLPAYQNFNSGLVPFKTVDHFLASPLVFNENDSNMGLGLINTDFSFTVSGNVQINHDLTLDSLLVENNTDANFNDLSIRQLNTNVLLNNEAYAENINIFSDIEFDENVLVFNDLRILGSVTLYGLELPNNQLQTSLFFAGGISSYNYPFIMIGSNTYLPTSMFLTQNLTVYDQLYVSKIIIPTQNGDISDYSFYDQFYLSQDGSLQILLNNQFNVNELEQSFLFIADDAFFSNNFYTSHNLFVNQLEIDKDIFVDAYVNASSILTNIVSYNHPTEPLFITGFMNGIQSGESHQLNSLYARAWGVSHAINERTDYATVWGNAITLSPYPLHSLLPLSASAMTAWGDNNFSKGQAATVWGIDNQVFNTAATSWGRNTHADIQNTTSWGAQTIADGINSTAWGQNNRTSGNTQTVFGHSNILSFLPSSTIWGNNNRSLTLYTTAWGNFTINSISGAYSTVFGDHTQANANRLTVLGKYNTNANDTDNPLFIIGSGTAQSSSNILEVYQGNLNPLLIVKGDLFVQDTIQAFSFDQADQVFMPILNTDAIIPFSETNQILDLSAFSAVFLQPGSNAEYSFSLANGEGITADFAVAWGENSIANQMLTSAWGKNTYANHDNASVMGLNTRSLTENSLSIGRYHPHEASLNHRYPIFVIGGGQINDPNFLIEFYPSKNTLMPATAIFHSNLMVTSGFNTNDFFAFSFANETISVNSIQSRLPESFLDMSEIESLNFESGFESSGLNIPLLPGQEPIVPTHFFSRGRNLDIFIGQGHTLLGVGNRVFSNLNDNTSFNTLWGEQNNIQFSISGANSYHFVFGADNLINTSLFGTFWGKRSLANHPLGSSLYDEITFQTAWASGAVNAPYATAFGANISYTDGTDDNSFMLLSNNRARVLNYGQNATALGQAISSWPNSFVTGKGNSLAPLYSSNTSDTYQNTFYIQPGLDEIPLGIRYPLFVVGKGESEVFEGQAINVLEVFNSYTGAYDINDQNTQIPIAVGAILNANEPLYISANVQADNLSLISNDDNFISTLSSPTINVNNLFVLNDQSDYDLNLTDFSLFSFGDNVLANSANNLATIWGSNTQVNTDTNSKATAWGDGAQAIASRATAWGKNTQALKFLQDIDWGFSVSWGNETITYGSSTGFGANNIVSANRGTSFGAENQVLDSQYATAFGKGAFVSTAHYSTTLGFNNYNIWPSSLVIGSYNTTDNVLDGLEPLFVIGGGTSDQNRLNVVEVYKHTDFSESGLRILGDLYVEGSMGIDFNDYQFYEGNYLLTHKFIPFTPTISTFNLQAFNGFGIGSYFQDILTFSTWGDENEIANNNENVNHLSSIWGLQNRSYHELQTIWGLGNFSEKARSVVFGKNNQILGIYGSDATLFGINSQANADISTAWGYDSEASGRGDTVWGQSSVAPNFIEASFNTLFGKQNAISSGTFSTVMGSNNVLNNQNAFALGRYIQGDINGLFFIGTGTSENDKKNILSVKSVDGSTVFQASAEFKVNSLLNFAFGLSVFAPLYDKNSFLHNTDSWGNTVFGEDSYISFDLDYLTEGFTGSGSESFFTNISENINSGTTFYPKNASAWGKNIFVIGDLVTAFGESNYPDSYPNLSYSDKVNIFGTAYGGRGLTVFGYQHMGNEISIELNNSNNLIEQYNFIFGSQNDIFPSHFSTVWGHLNTLAFNTNEDNLSNVDIEDHANQQSFQSLFGRFNDAMSFVGTGWGLGNQIGLFTKLGSAPQDPYFFDRYNTAWGKGVNSYADFSTAWGISTNAGISILGPIQTKYPFSTAWGQETQTASDNATVWGLNNISVGTVWGASNNSSIVNADTTVWGSFNLPVSNQASSAITIWGVSNHAFSNAVAFGKQSTANTEYSLGFGNHNHAVSSFSLAFGDNTIASANYSVAFGKNTSSNAENSLVAGDQNFSSGAMVFGNQNQHSGYSLALGSMNFASQLSAVFGHQNQINSYASLLAGELNQLNSTQSTVFGSNNVLNGGYASLFGRNTSMNADYSSSFGQDHYSLSNQDYAAFFGSGIKKDDDKSLWLINLLQDDFTSLPTNMNYQAIFGRNNFFLSDYVSLFGQSHGYLPLYDYLNNVPTPNLAQISSIHVSAFGYGHIPNGNYATYFGSEHNTHEFYYFTQQDSTIESSDVADNFSLIINPQYSTYFGHKNTTYGDHATAFGSLNSALGLHDTVFGTNHYAELRNFNTTTNQQLEYGSQILDSYPIDGRIKRYPISDEITEEIFNKTEYTTLFGSANVVFSTHWLITSILSTIFGESSFLNSDADTTLFGFQHVVTGYGGSHFGSYDVFYNGQSTGFNFLPHNFLDERSYVVPYFHAYDMEYQLLTDGADFTRVSMGFNLSSSVFRNDLFLKSGEFSSSMGYNLSIPSDWDDAFVVGQSNTVRVLNPDNTTMQGNPLFLIGNGSNFYDTESDVYGKPFEFFLGSTFTVYESGTILIANLNHFTKNTQSEHEFNGLLTEDGQINSNYANGFWTIPPKRVNLNVSGNLHHNYEEVELAYNRPSGFYYTFNALYQDDLDELPYSVTPYIIDEIEETFFYSNWLIRSAYESSSPLIFEHRGLFALDLPYIVNSQVNDDVNGSWSDTGVILAERPYQFSQFNITEDDTYTLFGQSTYKWRPRGTFTKYAYERSINSYPDEELMHLRILKPTIYDASEPEMGWDDDQYDDFRVVGYGIGHTSFGKDSYGRGAYSTSIGLGVPEGNVSDLWNNWIYTPPKSNYTVGYNIVDYMGLKNEYLGANGDFSFTKGSNLVAFAQSATLFGYYNEVKNEWAQNITVFGENNVIPTLNSEADSYQASFNSFNTIGFNATIFGSTFLYRDQAVESSNRIYGHNIKYGDINRTYESVYGDYNSLGSNVTLFGQGIDLFSSSNTRFDFFKDLLTHFGKENGNYGFNNTLFGYANQAGDYYLHSSSEIHPSYATTTFGSNNYIFSSKVLPSRTGNSGYDDYINAYHTIFGKHNIINFAHFYFETRFISSDGISRMPFFEFGSTDHNYNNPRGRGSNHTLFGQRNAISDFSELISHGSVKHHQIDNRTIIGQSIFDLSFSDKVSHGLVTGQGSSLLNHWRYFGWDFDQNLHDRNNQSVLSHALSSSSFNNYNLTVHKFHLFNNNHLFSFNGSRVHNYITTMYDLDDLNSSEWWGAILGFSDEILIGNQNNLTDLRPILRTIYPIENFDSSTEFDLDLLFNGPLFSLQDISGVSHDDPKSLYAAFYKSRADLYRGFLCVKQTDDNSNPMARMFLNMTSTLESSSDFEYIHFSHYLYRESDQDFYSIFFSQQQPNDNIVKTELLTIGESLFAYRDVSSNIEMDNNNEANLSTMYQGIPLFKLSGSSDSYSFINSQLYILTNNIPFNDDGSPKFSLRDSSYGLVVYGYIHVTGQNNTSDRRLKRDISSIKANIGDMMQLDPVSFVFNNDQTNRTNYGFIAQDILPFFPDLVTQSSDDIYALNYDGFYALAVSVIQQQQQVLNQQKATLEALNQELIELKQTFDTRLASLQP